MIHISNNNENPYDLKRKFKDQEVIIIDCYERKKAIKNELVEAIYSSIYVFNKKKLYIFTNSDLITNVLLNYLFKYYYTIPENKDIIFLNIGDKEIYIKKNFNKKFRYLGKQLRDGSVNFFDEMHKILCLNKNRTKLIDYSKTDVSLNYLLKLISYNLFNSKNLHRILKNTELIVKLGSFFNKIINNKTEKFYNVVDNDTIYNILDHSYLPLMLRRIEFPPKKEVKTKKNDNIEISNDITLEDMESIVSDSFFEELQKKGKKTFKTSKSMF